MQEQFGRELKFIRKKRGMTQAELAAKSGLSQATISRFEKGLQSPTY